MLIRILKRDVFPPGIIELLQAFYRAGFFEESLLIGSWVMPLYQEAFGMRYALRTLDVDFAVSVAARARGGVTDLEGILAELGYLPVTMRSGIRKYTRENFTVEFIIPRKGGSEAEAVSVRKWNITAIPLPFINILVDNPFTADFGVFRVSAPIPEAYLVQKLLTARRRPVASKKDKDLDQCAVIATRADADRLESVVRPLKLSTKSKNALREACATIDFPPQRLGLE